MTLILNFFYCSTYVLFSVIGAIQIRDDDDDDDDSRQSLIPVD